MIVNESPTERVVRSTAGSLLLTAVVFNLVGGAWRIVLGIMGTMLLLTGISGFCPLYRLIDACKAKAQA